MKIDFSKEEWECLKEAIYFLNYKCVASMQQDKILNNFLDKLGSEWVDDENRQ